VALFTPQFTWNILNYGRLTNNVRLEQARTQELIAAYQNRVLSAAQEVQTALRGFLRSQEQAEALSRAATAAAAATRIEEDLFSKVKADVNRLFTLANTQLQEEDLFNKVKADVNRLFTLANTQLQEQQNLAVAQGNIALNLISVYRALGGGWELRYHKDRCAQFPRRDAAGQTEEVPSAGPEALPEPKSLPRGPEER
jgi:outer membrane protein TolC